MITRRILLACSALVFLSGAEKQPTAGNVMCPVMTEQEAVDDYTILHRGQPVRFCCSECRHEFLEHPDRYEQAIPAFRSPSLRERWSAFYEEHTRRIAAGGLVLLLIGLRGWRFFRTTTPEDLASPLGRLCLAPCSGTVPLLLATCYLGYHFVGLLNDKYDRLMEDDIHYATFYDFGYPPKPERPPVDPRVQATFYRGNDERNPRLFNNGNYRTATFHISLCDEAGQQIRSGDDITNRQLFVKLVIDRPAFTPDFLYSDELMSKMFLTRECDVFLGRFEPVRDCVRLSATSPMQQWEARFPVGTLDAADLSGIVYVCEEYTYQPWYQPGTRIRGGSRFHYGIQYRLSAKDGLLADDSDLWMGALYRTRKFKKATVPLSEWFSDQPIPELPGDSNITDPELLGISDYLD